ncbi:PepSY domain-containing protein [Faecalimicrobium sp. JNUCC 81]
MKIKQTLIMGLGIIVGSSVTIAGLSYAYPSNNSSKINLITSEKAKSIMMNKVPGATILEFSYDGDDRIAKYDGTLTKDNFEYEIDIDAKTGDIIKFEKEKIDISNNTSNNKPNLDNNTNNDSNNKPNLDNNTNNNGNNKPNLDNSTNNNSNKHDVTYIGEAKAKSIMKNKVQGAKFVSFYLDNDDTPEYEGKLVKDNIEYEISVDAKTGEILEFDKEYIKSNTNSNNLYNDDYDDDHGDDDHYDDNDHDND